MKPLIIFGPSGVGKGTIIKYLQQKNPNLFQLTLSFTTRQPRKGEVHGLDYNFISHQQFEQKIKANEMLQHKVVFGNMYGTSKQSVEQIADKGKIPVMDVDVQGMLDIHKTLTDDLIAKQAILQKVKLQKPLCLCILPPSYQLLRRRLSGRKTESQQVVQKRMNENLRQVQRMLQIESTVQNLFYTTNFQFQSTVFGIERWLQKSHQHFAKHKHQKFKQAKQLFTTKD